MPFGDTLEKLARGERLSETEIQNIRLFGNQVELLNQFIGGMQTGSSDIHVKSFRTIYGDFAIPPTNGGWVGWEKLLGGSYPQNLSASNTFTVYTGYNSELLNSKSIITWFDKPNGKIALSQEFTATSPKIVTILGNVQVASPATALQVNLYTKRKSDNTQVTAVAICKDTGSPDAGADYKSFAFPINLASMGISPSDIYFEFQVKATYTTGGPCGMGLDVLFIRTI